VQGRQHLSADGLFQLIRSGVERIADHRRPAAPLSLADALMSALAMFALKDPSLLAFDRRRDDENMKKVFHIERVPSDTQMREILDPLDPETLRSLFGDVFSQLRRGKALEPFQLYRHHYLLALDGTGYFSSQQIHCDSCLQKVTKTTGEVTYHHQMVGAITSVHIDSNYWSASLRVNGGTVDARTLVNCRLAAASGCRCIPGKLRNGGRAVVSRGWPTGVWAKVGCARDTRYPCSPGWM
jgi:hypothetical protein